MSLRKNRAKQLKGASGDIYAYEETIEVTGNAIE